MSTTGIDWEKLGNQPASQTSGIDWSKIPAVGGERNPQTGSLTADQHPIEHRIDDLANDMKFGPGVNDNRLPERVMRAVGFRGTETGGTGSAGAAMPISGAVEGIPELIHAGSRIPQVSSLKDAESVAHEGISGGLKTLGGVAPFAAPEAMPMVVPAVATGGAAGTGASKVAGHLGASPETQQLVGDAASILVPGAHGLGEPVGRAMQTHAPALGRAAGYGATAASFLSGKKFNPLDLLFASDPVTKGASGAVRDTGKLIEGMGAIPFKDPSLPSSPRGVSGPEPEILPPTPKQLPRGPIQMPAPGEEPSSMLRPAQPVVARDTNTGRMRKSFQAGESTGKPVYNPEPLINTDSNPTPQAPPNVPQVETGLSSSALKPKLVQSQSAPAEAPAAEASSGEQGNGPTSYKDNLDSVISEYEKLMQADPNNVEAAKGLAEFHSLRDEINAPGYNNPFIDVNAPAEKNGTSASTEVVPNPGGTATDTEPGKNTPSEIPVKRLENGEKTADSKRSEPYQPVAKRPKDNFGSGPQLINR